MLQLRELDTPSQVSGEVDESHYRFLKCGKKNDPILDRE